MKKVRNWSIVVACTLIPITTFVVVWNQNRPKEVTPKRLYKAMLSSRSTSSGSEQIDAFLKMQ